MSRASSCQDVALMPIPELNCSAKRTHAVQFYAEDTFLVDELSRFVGSALVAGNAAIVIASKAHRNGLAERLQLRGLDVGPAIAQGRYIVLDAAETLHRISLDGWPDAALFHQVIGSVLSQASASIEGEDPQISAFGEMVALLWADGKAEAAVHLEQLWNDVECPCSFALLCAYPMSRFDRGDHSDLFLKICREHSHVVPAESYTALVGDEERLRSITYLQQKAQALEAEMAERKMIEDKLLRTQAELEFQIEQRTCALRRLSSRLLSLQDAERRRIARELHDSLGQSLVGLKVNVDILRQSPEREELWSKSEALMQQCIGEVRTLSYLLHPPTMDVAGFASAARWYVDGFGQRSGLQVHLDAPRNLGRLPDAVELALFRVLQEALTNIHRHSGASAAQIYCQADAEHAVLEVKDNGHGMPQELLADFHEAGAAMGIGVGLAGISERVRDLGGKLDLTSDNNGTVVRVTIPLMSSFSCESQV